MVSGIKEYDGGDTVVEEFYIDRHCYKRYALPVGGTEEYALSIIILLYLSFFYILFFLMFVSSFNLSNKQPTELASPI